MSLRYSFVTPVTSMVVTKPETEEGSGSPLIADKLTEGKEMLINQHLLYFLLFVRKEKNVVVICQLTSEANHNICSFVAHCYIMRNFLE